MMYNPAAPADPYGEWFELTADSDVRLSLLGCVLSDGEDDFIVDDNLVVEPGDAIVFGFSSGPAHPGAVYGDVSPIRLANRSDNLSLTCDGVVIDEIAWRPEANFPSSRNGYAIALDPGATDSWANDQGEAWCRTNVPTPGSGNPSCTD